MRRSARLLVEGKDDQHIIWQLLERFKVPQTFDVVNRNGIENMLVSLEADLRGDNVRLGIVIDADRDLAIRWQSIRDRLRGYGYDYLPLQPEPLGTIIKPDDAPIIGVWIMPDNQSNGMMEDFYAQIVSPDNLLWDRAVKVVDEIPAAERLFSPNHIMKANVHTWLAWQEEPGLPMGLGLKTQSEATVARAEAFIAWLQRLFLEA